MGDEFYLDHDGASSASHRFRVRAGDLEAAARDGAKGAVADVPGSAPVAAAADDLLLAVSGRLGAYHVALLSLSELVDDTVVVSNEIDVEYTL